MDCERSHSVFEYTEGCSEGRNLGYEYSYLESLQPRVELREDHCLNYLSMDFYLNCLTSASRLRRSRAVAEITASTCAFALLSQSYGLAL